MTEGKPYLGNSIGLAAWITAGGLAWCLSTYVLGLVMLPVTISITRAVDGTAGLPWAGPALRVLIPHTPEYLLSFGFCLVLGRVSRVTIARTAGFIIAANGISLYYHVMQLAGYAAHHYGGGSPALDWIILGMISILFISPVSAVMGSLTGRAWAGKKIKDSRRWV